MDRQRLRTRIATLTLGVLALILPSTGATAQETGALDWLASPESLLLVAEERDEVVEIRTQEELQRFRRSFWRRRDPEPSTPINEFRREFRDRLAFADREYAEPGKPGWTTARGHAYLVIGPPDRIARSHRQFFVDGAHRKLDVWDYAPRAGRPALRLLFAADADLLVRPGRGLDPTTVLERARGWILERAAREREIVAAEKPLPLTAIATSVSDGTFLEARTDVAELFGAPTAAGIAYRFRVEMITESATGIRRHSPGEFEFVLTADTLQEWGHEPLHLVAWIPSGTRTHREVRIVETSSGRSVRIRVEPGTLPGEGVPVAHRVASSPLGGGGGSAIAFFGTCDSRHTEAVALLVPGSPSPDPEAAPDSLPGGSLTLVAADRQR